MSTRSELPCVGDSGETQLCHCFLRAVGADGAATPVNRGSRRECSSKCSPCTECHLCISPGRHCGCASRRTPWHRHAPGRQHAPSRRSRGKLCCSVGPSAPECTPPKPRCAHLKMRQRAPIVRRSPASPARRAAELCPPVGSEVAPSSFQENSLDSMRPRYWRSLLNCVSAEIPPDAVSAHDERQRITNPRADEQRQQWRNSIRERRVQIT